MRQHISTMLGAILKSEITKTTKLWENMVPHRARTGYLVIAGELKPRLIWLQLGTCHGVTQSCRPQRGVSANDLGGKVSIDLGFKYILVSKQICNIESTYNMRIVYSSSFDFLKVNSRGTVFILLNLPRID